MKTLSEAISKRRQCGIFVLSFRNTSNWKKISERRRKMIQVRNVYEEEI